MQLDELSLQDKERHEEAGQAQQIPGRQIQEDRILGEGSGKVADKRQNWPKP